MKNEFNQLVEVMQKWDLFQADDEVGMALENLRKKIDEAEKRMECARRTAKEINKAISKYTDRVDSNELFIMKVVDHDSIYNCSNDIGYALDLEETMPIIDNWYELFTEEMESIAKKEMESIDKVVCYIFDSSCGHIEFNKYGYVIEVHGDIEINGERNYLYDIERFDVNEYAKFCKEFNITHGESGDILAIGYFTKDGKYSEPDSTWRKNMFGEEEDVKLKRGEPIPTYQCKDKETFDKVKQVIHLLKTLDNGSSVDGETMEYILEQVGMQEQMLRQLARKDAQETMAILEE